MNKSRRHHYVPRFLTNYFSKEDGNIYVYDKIADKFYEGSSINLFVERDRNTFVNSDGIEDDVIEKMYSSFDSLFAQALAEITRTGDVSNENFKLLLFLAYISKWRVPQYDESFENAKKYFSVDELGLGFKTSNGDRLDVNLEEYFDSDWHQESKRFLLAFQPFRFKDDFKTLIENSFLVSSPISSFISDCPFNEVPIVGDTFFEDFVFPVTKDLTLVYSNRIDRNEVQDFILNGNEEKVNQFLKDFSIGRDISILALSERNVGCCDFDYLQHTVNNYKEFKARGTDTPFNATVFNVLYRFNEYASR